MTTSQRVNDNVIRRSSGETTTLACTHCDQELSGSPQDYVSRLPWFEGPVTEAGPQVFADSRIYIDTQVVFRQFYCPGCYTALHTEVVPVDHAAWVARGT